jgi:DNA-binding response OmpR family regulator
MDSDEVKGTVLVVDDEEPIRNLVARRMLKAGYACVTAENGERALDKVSRQEFDLIILDIKMPGLSGMDVLPLIREKKPDACVIMATALVDMKLALQALNFGAFDYIVKPFDLDDLLARAEKALERKALLAGLKEDCVQQVEPAA